MTSVEQEWRDLVEAELLGDEAAARCHTAHLLALLPEPRHAVEDQPASR